MERQSSERPIGIDDILRRAWTDAGFKSALLENAKKVLEGELGVTFPSDVRIFVHEDTETDVHLVLPRPPYGQSLP